jgi:hypothetical protein
VEKEGFSAVYFVVEIAAETVKEEKAFLTNDDYKDRDDMVRRYVWGCWTRSGAAQDREVVKGQVSARLQVMRGAKLTTGPETSIALFSVPPLSNFGAAQFIGCSIEKMGL